MIWHKPEVDRAAPASPNPGGPLLPEAADVAGRFSMAPSGMLMGSDRPNAKPIGLPKEAEKEELAELGSSLGSCCGERERGVLTLHNSLTVFERAFVRYNSDYNNNKYNDNNNNLLERRVPLRCFRCSDRRYRDLPIRWPRRFPPCRPTRSRLR